MEGPLGVSRPVQVRLARAEDHPALTAAMARAFDDDPILRWVYPRAGRRARYGPAFFRWSLWRCADQGVTWTADDLTCTAVWALPDRWRVTLPELARLVRWSGRGIGLRGPQVAFWPYKGRTASSHDKHLYLAVLGVDPAQQGGGISSALIAPGLHLCDREGLPAYLETGEERNLAFYARHGFRVTDQLTLPGGPPVWLMRREPR